MAGSRDLKQEQEMDLGSTPSPVDVDADAKDVVKKQTSLDKKLGSVQDNNSWHLISPSGNAPRARYHHSAAVVGRKMVVIGGDSDLGLLNDVQQLHLSKLCWSKLGTKSSFNTGLSKVKASQQLPPCRGHHLINWGQKVLLVTGETDPPMETVSVWSFDMEKENWSLIEAKGETPVARTGHSVTRAGSVLILFGGEDTKGRKLNDLIMFDLKSSMWLPLFAMGSVPSPRSKHVAAIYDDRLLFVFGGVSKSKYLNDLYALDFEAMEWSRLKTRGVSPHPRAEAAGVLFGDKWYIVGGQTVNSRCLETIMLDVARMTWSVIAYSNDNSPSASQGCSLVVAQRKDRVFLIAYGGKRPGLANEVEVLRINEQSIPNSRSPSPSERVLKRTSLADNNTQLMSTMVLSQNTFITDGSSEEKSQHVGDGVLITEGHNRSTRSQHDCCLDELSSNEKKGSHPDGDAEVIRPDGDAEVIRPDGDAEVIRPDGDTEVLVPSVSDDAQISSTTHASDMNQGSYELCRSPREMNHDAVTDTGQDSAMESKLAELQSSYEKKLSAALRRNAVLEEQLQVLSNNKEEAEKNLSAIMRSRHKTEKKLAVVLKENEELREKLASAEIAREESINLTNIVHAENLRLENDLAFLKAVLEDTQKELQTTRGVLSEERSRSFQLQVELFELKQTIQNYQKSPVVEKDTG